MASALLQCDPEEVMVIRKVRPDIITCSLPFSRFGYLKIGGRGTIVRLQSGSLVVFSATPLTKATKDEVTSLGGVVKYLIAPGAEHYLFIKDWLSSYPSAKVIGPAGVESKLQKLGVELSIPVTKENHASLKLDEDFTAEFELAFVAGVLNEIVLLNKPEKTLLVADVLSNLPAKEQYSKAKESELAGLLTKTYNGMRGTSGSSAAWQKRVTWAIASSDRKAFDEAVTRIAGWNFERIVVCHGDVIETGGKEVWMDIFQGHLLKGGK